MKTFKQYLNEGWISSFNSSIDHAEVFKNPSHKEVKEITKYGNIRAIAHKNDIYAWHPEKAFHHEMALHLKEKGHISGFRYHTLNLNHKEKLFNASSGNTNKELENHPWLKKHGYKAVNE